MVAFDALTTTDACYAEISRLVHEIHRAEGMVAAAQRAYENCGWGPGALAVSEELDACREHLTALENERNAVAARLQELQRRTYYEHYRAALRAQVREVVK